MFVKQASDTSALISDVFGNVGQSLHFLDNSSGGVTFEAKFDNQNWFTFEYDILSANITHPDSGLGLESVHPTLMGDIGNGWTFIFLSTKKIGIVNDIGNFDTTDFLDFELDEWYHVTQTVNLNNGTGSMSIFQIDNPSSGRTRFKFTV